MHELLAPLMDGKTVTLLDSSDMLPAITVEDADRQRAAELGEHVAHTAAGLVAPLSRMGMLNVPTRPPVMLMPTRYDFRKN